MHDETAQKRSRVRPCWCLSARISSALPEEAYEKDTPPLKRRTSTSFCPRLRRIKRHGTRAALTDRISSTRGWKRGSPRRPTFVTRVKAADHLAACDCRRPNLAVRKRRFASAMRHAALACLAASPAMSARFQLHDFKQSPRERRLSVPNNPPIAPPPTIGPKRADGVRFRWIDVPNPFMPAF